MQGKAAQQLLSSHFSTTCSRLLPNLEFLAFIATPRIELNGILKGLMGVRGM